MKYHHIKKTSNTPSTNHRRISNTHGVTTLTPLADLETWPVVLREAHSASSSPCPVRLHALSKKEILRGGNLIYIYDVCMYIYIYKFMPYYMDISLYIYNVLYVYIISIFHHIPIADCQMRISKRPKSQKAHGGGQLTPPRLLPFTQVKHNPFLHVPLPWLRKEWSFTVVRNSNNNQLIQTQLTNFCSSLWISLRNHTTQSLNWSFLNFYHFHEEETHP